MNNRWRRRYRLLTGKKLTAFLKKQCRFDAYMENLKYLHHTSSFRKGAKHYATKRS